MAYNIPHVRRWFNRRDKLENNVSDANDANKATGDVLPPGFTDRDGTNKDVDWHVQCLIDVALPRPTYRYRDLEKRT
jgi:hypothetical protein